MRESALLVRAFVQASKFPVRTSKLLVSGFWPLKIPEAFCQESKFRFLAFQIPEPFFQKSEPPDKGPLTPGKGLLTPGKGPLTPGKGLLTPGSGFGFLKFRFPAFQFFPELF